MTKRNFKMMKYIANPTTHVQRHGLARFRPEEAERWLVVHSREADEEMEEAFHEKILLRSRKTCFGGSYLKES